MKVSSKPISSPGRAEKFPPPLMRLLRSNVGSKSSRGKSRASPMFVRKKNAAIETTQEPSSPKVTCMGQVRVRRSGSKSNRTGRFRTPARSRRCGWVRKVLFCHRKLKPRSLRPVWRKWVLFFRFGYCKKADIRDDTLKLEANRRGQYEIDDVEKEEEEEGAEDREEKEDVVSCSPPKNAFLLTRCRSAPYRSSSLASRLWESPLPTSETGEEEDETEKVLEEQKKDEERQIERPISRIEQEAKGIYKEIEGSINESTGEDISIEELKATKGGLAGPLILTRCKSEPARTGDKLINQNEVGFC